VKKPRKKKSPSKTKSKVPDVEVWDDPEWRPALDALEGWPQGCGYTGKSDPKPLAKLLCSGKAIPGPVAWRLGILLDPPWGRKGKALTLSFNKRYTGQTELKRIKEMIDLKKKIEVAKKANGKLEAAIEEVKRKTGKSRSHLLKAWKFTLEDGLPLLARYNPQMPQSPRDPGKS
jgi:hypothetical protein